jgi:hypothetical protein
MTPKSLLASLRIGLQLGGAVLAVATMYPLHFIHSVATEPPGHGLDGDDGESGFSTDPVHGPTQAGAIGGTNVPMTFEATQTQTPSVAKRLEGAALTAWQLVRPSATIRLRPISKNAVAQSPLRRLAQAATALWRRVSLLR